MLRRCKAWPAVENKTETNTKPKRRRSLCPFRGTKLDALHLFLLWLRRGSQLAAARRRSFSSHHEPSLTTYSPSDSFLLKYLHCSLLPRLAIYHGIIIVIIARAFRCCHNNVPRIRTCPLLRPQSRRGARGPLKVRVLHPPCVLLPLTMSSRFILNLPEAELTSVERVCFQVEQASVTLPPCATFNYSHPRTVIGTTRISSVNRTPTSSHHIRSRHFPKHSSTLAPSLRTGPKIMTRSSNPS